jgi:hypothetical protein
MVVAVAVQAHPHFAAAHPVCTGMRYNILEKKNTY